MVATAFRQTDNGSQMLGLARHRKSNHLVPLHPLCQLSHKYKNTTEKCLILRFLVYEKQLNPTEENSLSLKYVEAFSYITWSSSGLFISGFDESNQNCRQCDEL